MTDALVDPVEIGRDLLVCPSITPSEGGALEYLARILKQAGFDVHLLTFSEAGTPDVTNLFAKLGEGAPHLAFAGHTDVVPPGDEGRWTHDPFSGMVADGQLWGRGAVDMKGGIACFVAAVLRHLKRHGKVEGSVSFLITGDEEGPAVNGTVKLLEWAAERGERFDACLVGEPTNPDRLGDAIKVGRRGSLSGTVTVYGKQGHVAYPHLAENPIPALTRMLSALQGEPMDAGTDRFDPSNLEVVSVDVGNMTWNVIPAEAHARFNIRYNDLWTRETIAAWLTERLDTAACGARYRLTLEASYSDAFLTRSEHLISTLAEAIADVTGRSATLSTSGGTSDARFIRRYCPVVEFGLVGKTMHQIDERVPIDDLETLTRIYEGFIDRFFAGGASVGA